MAPAVMRRLTPVIYAKQFLSAIRTIRLQKQIPNFERISRYVQRFSDLAEDEIKEYLNDAVYDGFIDEYTAVGVKGQRTGLEQEGYRITQRDEEDEDDGHDWYCFECHRPGEVYECSSCFRVFHRRCTRELTGGPVFACSICQASRQKNRVKKKMLNSLLGFTMSRLREKTRELYKFGYLADEEECRWFVYKPMDLDLMEENVRASRYKSVDEFHADAQLIVHNCALIYGEDKGTLTELAIAMAIDSKHELDEIDVCPNCYYLSNAMPANWFSEICDPPHEIVYAKQKGFGYWPAKVVQDFDGKYDVRFFGSRHQRAVIPSRYIQPISTDLRTLPVRKSAAFQKSMVELRKYQKKLQKSEKTETNKITEECEENSWGEFKNGKSTEINEAEHEQDEHYENTCEVKQRSSQSTKRQPKQSKAERRDSSKIQNRKAEKRKNKAITEAELEDEVANRQVTSTSVEQYGKKRSRKSFQNNFPDETYTVTSTVDKITNTPEVATVSIAVQTSVAADSTFTQTDDAPSVQADSTFTQTDDAHSFQADSTFTQTDDAPSVQADSTFTQTDDAPSVQESLRHLNDRLWEERMVKALKSLTKKMEIKFEEEKKLALKELTQQLQEDFGKDKQQAVERTLASMKMEAEKARKAGEDKAREQYMEEMKKLAARHKDTISQVKKRQWCQSCEEEAMYHCCWNTSYCNVKCQQEHWHKEHKRVCRRKRP